MRVLTTKLRIKIENEMRVFLETLNFKIEMRVSKKSVTQGCRKQSNIRKAG